jgi:hypothetical protein
VGSGGRRPDADQAQPPPGSPTPRPYNYRIALNVHDRFTYDIVVVTPPSTSPVVPDPVPTGYTADDIATPTHRTLHPTIGAKDLPSAPDMAYSVVIAAVRLSFIVLTSVLR